MTLGVPDPVILLASASLLGLFMILRLDARREHLKRISNLSQSAVFLEQHAEWLEKFLAAPDAPDEMKAVLIAFSDATLMRDVATQLAETIVRRTVPTLGPESAALFSAIEDLRIRRSDLAEAFSRAVGAGVAAALLRWPETSEVMEIAASRLVADPRQGIATVTDGARIVGGIRFGLQPSATVMAA